MSTILTKRKFGTFPRNTNENPKNEDNCIAITNQCGKSTNYQPLPIVDEPTNDSVMVDETLEA